MSQHLKVVADFHPSKHKSQFFLLFFPFSLLLSPSLSFPDKTHIKRDTMGLLLKTTEQIMLYDIKGTNAGAIDGDSLI